MAGVEKNILLGNGFKLQPSAAGDIALTNHLATDISFLNITGSPAGVVSANPSSLTFDVASGNIYRKSSGTGTAGWVLLNSIPSAGAVGTILRSDGSNWVATTSTYPNTNAINTLLYASAANTMSALATANNGLLVTGSTGVPSILAGPGATGRILQSNAAAAPSFSTATYPSTGGTADTLLRSDGTNWVNTSAFKISSADIMTNTAQPCLLAFVNAVTSNVTGDRTAYQVVFGGVPYQQGSNYNSGTGVYTVPVTGVYQVTGMITLTNLSASFTSAELGILSNAGTFSRQLFNPGLIRDSGNNLSIVFSGLNQYTAGNTIYIQITVNGGTKTVGIQEESFGQFSYLGILKVA